jgi:hypothetical protein
MWRDAVAERNQQREGHRGFTDGLPAELVKEWKSQCKKWEMSAYPKSKTAKVNPYAVDDLCE